jgi:hypothetical protein
MQDSDMQVSYLRTYNGAMPMGYGLVVGCHNAEEV